jgi:hypothetical protein
MSYRLITESGKIIQNVCWTPHVNRNNYHRRIEGKKSRISTIESRRHLTMPTLSMMARASLKTYTYKRTLTMT